jgi:hypothetical protein
MGKLSLRRAAAIKLSDLYRVAFALRERGEILDPSPWLKVLANILSSAPPKWLGDRRGKRRLTISDSPSRRCSGLLPAFVSHAARLLNKLPLPRAKGE